MIPKVNPLPKTLFIRQYIKQNGIVVPAHRAKPKFRHNAFAGLPKLPSLPKLPRLPKI